MMLVHFQKTCIMEKNLPILQNFLPTQGLQTTPIERHKQVSKRYLLAELMPHDCNERQISNVYRSTEYGKVGLGGKTYAEKYYPKGRYFPDTDSYDNVNALSLEQKHGILKTSGIRYTQENI